MATATADAVWRGRREWHSNRLFILLLALHLIALRLQCIVVFIR